MGDWKDLFNGENLEGWTANTEHAWRVAGGVALHPENNQTFAIQPGTGVMVNGDDGRTADLRTTLEHGSCELHVEFCIAAKSNSGVYLMGQYEIQILDSAEIADAELTDHSNGAIYPRWRAETKSSYDGHAPRVNASRPAGQWQSYDVLFHAPQFDGSGRKVANARFERVLHNGVLIHAQVECTGPTRGAWSEEDIPRGPLRLQGDHGPVAFRNVRIRLLE